MNCPKCNTVTTKYGFAIIKNKKIQKYSCEKCEKVFLEKYFTTYKSFEDAKKFIQKMNIKSRPKSKREYTQLHKLGKLPNLPRTPYTVYGVKS